MSRRPAKDLQIPHQKKAVDFTKLLVKSGGSEPPLSKKPVTTASNKGLGMSQICWQNLAESEPRSSKMPVNTALKKHRDFTHLLAKSGGSERDATWPRPLLVSANMSHHVSKLFSGLNIVKMCEIPSPCLKAVFTSVLLGRGSLPPDFASGCVKSLALCLMQYLHALQKLRC